MKAVTIDQFGGPEVMQISDLPIPQPNADEVQIQNYYTSVNPVDWKIREGYLEKLLPHEFPLVLGWDAAGIITAVGKEVTNLKVGDEVYAYCRKPTVQWGTYAEFTCFSAEHVALKPKTLSFAQAAAIPLVGLTAWQALFDSANLREEQTVLIHAGAGGVGSMAIEFARIAGAKVYTTASPKNHEYVTKLGADFAIDYHEEDFVTKIQEMEPDGVDVVFDCVGYETLERSFDIVKPGGYLISIVNQIDEHKAREYNIHSDFVFVRPDGAQLEKIANLFDEEQLQAPHIEEFSLKEYRTALDKNKEGHTRGKIVLRIKD